MIASLANIDEFGLNWIRADQKASLSEVHPEADAFQKICGNILSDVVFKESTGLNFHLLPFKLLGADGGIDHYGYENRDETTFVECKKNGSYKNALDEIQKLRKKFSAMFGREATVNSAYKPWYNPKFKRYVFCSSCQPANAAEFEGLVSAIKEMLHHIGSIDQRLSHVESAEVCVYTWPELKAWMEQSPFLMYKWVEPAIEGVEYISKKSPYAEGYRSYLSSSKIPYISRDSFIQQNPHLPDLPSEKGFMSELISNQAVNYQGLVIFGEGGIGKTRLMRELALMAQKSGWFSYKVSALVNFREFISLLRPGGKYLILFDYIEELPEFSEWVEDLTQKERPFEVKIIANCRNSYISNVRLISSFHFLKMDISNVTDSSRRYYSFVVNRIIEGIPALKSINKGIFKYRPSFAVFVRYLYDRDRKYEFDLLQDESFQSWIMRRLRLSFSKLTGVPPDSELLARLFSCLPTHGKGKAFLEHTYTSEISTLLSDGWIEFRDEYKNPMQKQLSVIHDTIADEVLLEYLENNQQLRNVVIEKLFAFATENFLIYGCSRSFERIRDSRFLEDFDFVSVYSKMIAVYPEQMKESYYHLVKTSLISEEQMIGLYSKHKEFFTPYITSADFAGPLSYLLNDFSKRGITEDFHIQVGSLYRDWYSFNNDIIFSNRYVSKIISTAIKFFGHDHQKELVKKYLSDFSESLDASFVIGKWLESGGEKTIVRGHICKWLAVHDKSSKASFVFSNWLAAKGEIEIIKEHLLLWLAIHGNAPEALFVYNTWLGAGGDTELVKGHLSHWLVIHATVPNSSFVIGNWLKAGGEIEIVKDHIPRWLAIHDTLPEASFVFGNWFKMGGGIELVKNHIPRWLAIHDTLPEASFVFGNLLEAGGGIEILRLHLPNWLSIHDKTPEASFVIGKWLEMVKDTEIIRMHLTNWLSVYDQAPEARFVIGNWLEAEGDIEVIRSHLPNWLSIHDKTPEARFVIGKWFEAGGDIETIRMHLFNWLSVHDKTQNASFVIEDWFKSGGGY